MVSLCKDNFVVSPSSALLPKFRASDKTQVMGQLQESETVWIGLHYLEKQITCDISVKKWLYNPGWNSCDFL